MFFKNLFQKTFTRELRGQRERGRENLKQTALNTESDMGLDLRT